VEWMDILKLASPLVAAIWMIATMKAAQKEIISRLDKLENNIEKAHDRLDRHIIEWHKK